ncbi:MAG: hypothetical protein JW716_00855 [Candidatus Aenigmarchaeota archaeon]|nr:hypothetical protein [Candidatus Aenigmarchaeota archaeon]
MIPVHRLLLKFLGDRQTDKSEFEIVVADPAGRLSYYNLEDVMVDESNPETFTFIDEDDSFIKISYSDVRKVLRNEKPVWEKG